MNAPIRTALSFAVLCALAGSAAAAPFTFSTGDPDGRIATGSRSSSPGKIEIESGDDFILSERTRLDGASFTGLLPAGANVDRVTVEIYRVFPKDSDTTRTPAVPTRVNSPSDVELDGRDSGVAGELSFTLTLLDPNFTAANSVLNGIHPLPNQTTGGEGPASGQEVRFDIDFLKPLLLDPDHYFFVPQVGLDNGDFLWLSAPRPIVAPGTPFAPDLQSWIRDQDLDPDWLRVGTDIIGGTPAPTFNAVFALRGATIPEPATLALLAAGLAGLRRRRAGPR